MLALARRIDPDRAPSLEARFARLFGAGSPAAAAATLLASAYPSMTPSLEAEPDIARQVVSGLSTARDRPTLLRRMTARVGPLSDAPRVLRELRRATRLERARVALREILPASLGGADLDVTAAEISALADVTLEIAFEEALFVTSQRFGAPRTAAGARARFAVLGMGKLGGDELNPGSDVDLVYVYDTDEGAAEAADGSQITLHDFWTRVARRMTATLDEATEDGFVWRVDLRLRPEGRSGPLVNSLAAAERYYEAFGRLWERAAMLRARPSAGDLEFGAAVLSALEPFVWRRAVDPRIAVEMVELARRSRVELSTDPARDLKLGPGGIREAEFFVQTLELIWGGRDPRLRAKGTLDGLRRLRARGLVSDREFREIASGYLALRRAEHVVQVASGLQTHAVPENKADRDRLARALGFSDAAAFDADLARHTTRIAARFASLLPDEADERAPVSRWNEAFAALERSNPDAFVEAVARIAERAPSSPFEGDEALERWTVVARDLAELAKHPDGPLGARTRESLPLLPLAVLDAVVDAADPEQAARFLRRIFARVRHPGVYARLLADDRRAVRRFVEALGASAFVGEAVANHPELGDFVMFARGAPTPALARAEIAAAEIEARKVDTTDRDERDEALVAELRRAKARVTIEVALADLAGELDTRGATLTLSELADATLDVAARRALETPPGELVSGLAVVAMGKLGGREIGYGSDLDILFLYDAAAAPAGVADPQVYFARAARRMMRLIGTTHPAGPGYELDTRLRPSGSQGLLVTSLEAFASYHGAASDEGGKVRVRAAAWERLALLRARAAAGDADLGARAIAVAHAAAYDLPFEARATHDEIHRLRTRLLEESSQERKGRYDVKLGKGGLVDVEFAVQLLQLEHGRDRRVRTSETQVAIEALAATGHLAAADAEVLRDGHAFLRKLEQRLRIVHDSSLVLLEESAPGLVPLARRMGSRNLRGREAAAELLARYLDVTARVHRVFDAIVTA